MFFKDKLKLVKLPVSRILPNPAQPRKDFDQAALESLAQSIKENGLLQPVTVRRENGGYTLIAGERRLRACKLAGLKEIPAIVTECAPEDSALLALLENLQRKDLQMFEQANALVNLLREWHITQEEAAKRLGISQSYLANKLRLLKLSPEEQSEILEYKLTERHARALLRLPDRDSQMEAFDYIASRHLNVAAAESYIDRLLAEKQRSRRRATFILKDVRVFLNSLDRSLELMQRGGIAARVRREDTPDGLVLTISIPRSRNG